ncbi:MAG: hypothetical protein GY826_22600 [Fuerstiella sp.]|nr:hypothetical protein [Fuerstiella sp.]
MDIAIISRGLGILGPKLPFGTAYPRSSASPHPFNDPMFLLRKRQE